MFRKGPYQHRFDLDTMEQFHFIKGFGTAYSPEHGYGGPDRGTSGTGTGSGIGKMEHSYFGHLLATQSEGFGCVSSFMREVDTLCSGNSDQLRPSEITTSLV